MYEITDAVPLPSPITNRLARFPLDRLQIGESFVVPRSDAAAVRVSISKNKARWDGRNYTTRLEANGLRVWRIA